MTNISNTQTAHQKFCTEITDLFDPNNSSGIALIKYAKAMARRYPGSDPNEILQKAIYQGLQYTHGNGIEIKTPAAWLRTAIMGILNNQVRKSKNEKKLAETWRQNHPTTSNDPSEKLECEDTSEQIKLALQTLSNEDQEILNLYVYQDKSYEEIKKYYEPEDIQIGTIRQRVSRAIKRLAKAFHSLNQE
jgi:RNA polymerase sigma factor (sigma-70 family)